MDRSNSVPDSDDEDVAADQRSLPGFACDAGPTPPKISLDSVSATGLALIDSGLRHIILLAVRRDAGALAQIEVLAGPLAKIAGLLAQGDTPATRTALERELGVGTRALGIGVHGRHHEGLATNACLF